jgi:hypothetical protein
MSKRREGKGLLFTAGQVVCITELEPVAYAKLLNYDEDYEAWNTAEGYFSEHEMRELTITERGLAPKQQRKRGKAGR